MFSRFFNKNPKKAPHKNDSSSKDGSDGLSSSLSSNKLKAIISSLNQAEPIFTRAGYRMEQLDVEFGIEQRITPHFKQLELVSQQKQDELLAELNDQQLIKFIIISLNKSGRMQSLFENSELYYYGVEIDISSNPSVRTIFKRKDSMAEVIPIKPNL